MDECREWGGSGINKFYISVGDMHNIFSNTSFVRKMNIIFAECTTMKYIGISRSIRHAYGLVIIKSHTYHVKQLVKMCTPYNPPYRQRQKMKLFVVSCS